MRRFIHKLVAYLIIFSMVFICLSMVGHFLIGSQYQYNYQASLVDKVHRLRSIGSPKIILVGNSNLSFGIVSERIEKALKMPVVNLGLHGGLGNAFHEEIAKLNINAGDIVVVCHSEFPDLDIIRDPLLAWIPIDLDPRLWVILREKDYPAMITAYPAYLKRIYTLWITRQGNRDSGDCYSRNAFNVYGDVERKPSKGQMDVIKFFSSRPDGAPKIGTICTNRLNEYNRFIAEHGAKMVVAAYPIAYGKFSNITESDYKIFQSELQDALDCDVISDYTDYMYPYEYFYNTHLHLTQEGAEKRTDQLIADLKAWMGK